MSEKYYCDLSSVRDRLEEYGVAIIPSILVQEEIIAMQKGMFDYLEHITADFETPIDRNKPETFVEFYKLFPNHSMLIQHWQVGHAQFIWDLRQNPRIAEVFASIWKCAKEDLLTSFDGASFHLSAEITKRGAFSKLWYHVDQSYTRSGFEAVQSWITAFDVNEGDATLAFLEGSHKFHQETQEAFEINDRTDWYKLSEVEIDFYKNNECEEKKIVCPAGSLVLWDSRLVHCGVQHVKDREKPNFRCVAYICMTPRELTTEANLKKKRDAFENMRMTSHWPHKPKLFPVYPRTYGATLPKVRSLSAPILNELGKRLAGFNSSSV